MTRVELLVYLARMGDAGIERFILWCNVQSSLVSGPWPRPNPEKPKGLRLDTLGVMAAGDMAYHYANAWLVSAMASGLTDSSEAGSGAKGFPPNVMWAYDAGERHARKMQRLWLETYTLGLGSCFARNAGVVVQ